MLVVRDLDVAYGHLQILFGVGFTAEAGKITCILGRNGAGKTTTMRALMGLLPARGGTITLNDEVISGLPAHEVPKRRMAYVPQGRRLFTELTVAENIEVGLMTRGEGADTRDWVLEIFPRLQERLKQRAETLSGGEQQMLAMARAMCVRPRVLLLDEPTEGLQPSMIESIRQVAQKMRDEGVAVILVEQRTDAILSMADHAVFLENGRVVEVASGDDLRAAPERLAARLGV
ncbi:MAG: ABC transporter ATP-binding protein [Pseudomonadota bacterium]